MAKEKFERLHYRGPVSCLHILTAVAAGSKAKPKQNIVPLVPGETYTNLPPDHPVVMNLKAHGFLVAPDGDGDKPADPEPNKTDA